MILSAVVFHSDIDRNIDPFVPARYVKNIAHFHCNALLGGIRVATAPANSAGYFLMLNEGLNYALTHISKRHSSYALGWGMPYIFL